MPTQPRLLTAALAGWFAASVAIHAQPAQAAKPQDPLGETVELSPFVVSSELDTSYRAINNLEDALRFSLSIENQSEWYDPSGSENTLGGNPFNPSAGNRARGLARASTSVGFFETSSKIDSDNTERYSFVGGPNALLFGNDLTAGSVDTPFKRAGVNQFWITNYNVPDPRRFTLTNTIAF